MKRSRQRKLFVGIFGVCLLALGVDRVLLGGGTSAVQEAAAEPVLPSNHITPQLNDRQAATSETIKAPLAIVAARLEESLSDDEGSNGSLPDVFRRPNDWTTGDAPITVLTHHADGAVMFRESHRFTAVMIAGGESMAVIDGRARRVGELIDEFKLVGVGPRQIVLEYRGNTVRVNLP